MFDILPFISHNPFGFSVTRRQPAPLSGYNELFLPFHSTRNSVSNQQVTEERALKLSAVWACVNIRRQTIAAMPCHLKNCNKKISNHIVNFLLHSRPNSIMTPSVFWGLISTHLDLSGNAYIKINKKGNNINSFEIINPKNCIPAIKNGNKIFIVIEKNNKGETVKKEYNTLDIIHIMGLSRNGIVGLSPIEYAAETIGDLISIEKNYSFTVSKAMKTTAVLDTGARKTDKQQRDELQERFALFSDPAADDKRLMILDNGYKISGEGFLSLTPQAAQLIENRNFGVEEICRAFGVPPALIGHNKNNVFAKSIEEINQLFLTYGINPTLVSIEQAFEKNIFEILPELVDFTIHFNRSALLQADMTARFDAYGKAVQNGIFSSNEIRDWEDLPQAADENANKLRCQVNMTTLENLGKTND